MILFPHHVELLVQLGLTFTEAKIFLVLCTIGTLTARMISENAGVAREVVYQILPTLQEKGLIESVLTTPQTYRAIPAEYAFEILLKRKNEENKKTKKEIHETLNALKKVQNPPSDDCHQITTVPRGKALQSKIISEMRNAQKNVDIVISWQKFLKWHRLYANDIINQAKLRNVKFQVLVEKEVPQSMTPSLSSLVFGTNYFEYLHIRAAPNASLTNMIIFDNKKVFLDTASDKGLLETPCMYSNNPCLTPLATSYFQTNWDIAIPLQSVKSIYKTDVLAENKTRNSLQR
jgi:sugar-specific transcriptional regulator TrmB